MSILATNAYSPDGKLASFLRIIDLKSLFDLFLATAFPTFLEATKPIFVICEDLKKATKE